MTSSKLEVLLTQLVDNQKTLQAEVTGLKSKVNKQSSRTTVEKKSDTQRKVKKSYSVSYMLLKTKKDGSEYEWNSPAYINDFDVASDVFKAYKKGVKNKVFSGATLSERVSKGNWKVLHTV